MIVLLSAGLILNTQFHLFGSKSKPQHTTSQIPRSAKSASKSPKKEISSLGLKPDQTSDAKTAASDVAKKPTSSAEPNINQGESKTTDKIAQTTAPKADKNTDKNTDKNADKNVDYHADKMTNKKATQKTAQKTDRPQENLEKTPGKTRKTALQGTNKTSPNLISNQQTSQSVKSAVSTVKIQDVQASSEDTPLDTAPIPQRSPIPQKQGTPSDTASKLEIQNAKGRVSISSTPAAELYIDGKRYGTTNDLGTSSEWIELNAGFRRVELRRAGFITRTESINVINEDRQKLGPYTLQRSDLPTSKTAVYRLTLSTNTPPVTVTLVQIETRSSQTIAMSQTTQTINLERGIYDVTMNHNGDIRKRRIDLSGAAQQLTFSVDFKQGPSQVRGEKSSP